MSKTLPSFPRSELLELYCTPTARGGVTEMQILIQLGRGQLRFWISNKFPSNADQTQGSPMPFPKEAGEC